MTENEKRAIALKIVQAEKFIQSSENKQEIIKKQNEIINLTDQIHSIEDLLDIDELAMSMLEVDNFQKIL